MRARSKSGKQPAHGRFKPSHESPETTAQSGGGRTPGLRSSSASRPIPVPRAPTPPPPQKPEHDPSYPMAEEALSSAISAALSHYPRAVVRRVLGKTLAEFDRRFPVHPLATSTGEATACHEERKAVETDPPQSSLPEPDDLSRGVKPFPTCARCGAQLHSRRGQRLGFGHECIEFVPQKARGTVRGYREELRTRHWVENVTMDELLYDRTRD